MFNRFYLFIFLISVFLVENVLSGSGKSGAIILTQPIGANASGMGEAYTSIRGDIYVLHYNPAGIGEIKDNQLSLLYQSGLVDEAFGAIAFGMPTKIGGFGTSLIYYTAGKIELIDLSGNVKNVNAQQDILFNLGYGKNIIKNLSFGLNTKFLSSQLVDKFSANTYAFDFGCSYRIFEPVNCGISIQNIGGQIKYKEEGDNLPLIIRSGVSYDFNKTTKALPLLCAIDIVKNNDEEKIKEHIGLEYRFKAFSLRGGYKFGYDLDSLALGIGIGYSNFRFDYSYGMMGDLNVLHKVSLYAKLGKKKEEIVPVVAPPPVEVPKPVKPPEPVLPEVIVEKPASKYVIGSAKIPESAYSELVRIALFLKEHPEYDIIEIVGHTCSIGSEKVNQELSIKRAKEVADYFINVQNIPESKIVIKGEGYKKPVASNDTEEGRLQNRRVEVILKRSVK